MWIRDALPQYLSSVRFLLYGYNTTLVKSSSFQGVHDLAVSLINQLNIDEWSSPTSNSLVFLAHSLGGVVLKQTLLIMANSTGPDHFILPRIRGAVFFGVPSRGMAIPDILAMLEDQPNTALVDEISDRSQYLANLERQFRGISYIQRMKLFWAYETKTSPTVEVRETAIAEAD